VDKKDKDSKQTMTLPTEIEVPTQQDGGAESALSPATKNLRKAPPLLSMTPTISTSASASDGSLRDRTDVPTPESDRVSSDNNDTEGLVDPDTKVTYVTSQIFVTQGGIYQKMPHDRVQNLARRSAYLIVTREPRIAWCGDCGSVGQLSKILCRDNVTRMVTAKHALQKKFLGDQEYEVNKTFLCSPHVANRFLLPLKAADIDCQKIQPGILLRDNKFWEWGIDIAFSRPLTSEGLGSEEKLNFLNEYFPTENLGAFEMVRADFECQVGQRIGMVIYNRYAVTPENRGIANSSFVQEENNQYTTEELAEIFGPSEAIVIHEGIITFVGEHHIEYNINTHRGCSGATVFLLDDENQPASVQAEDCGKAIAGHAGRHPSIGDIDVGFKFTNADE
jgi:hypothetical protein